MPAIADPARSRLKDTPRLVRQPGRNTVLFLLPKRKAGHAPPAPKKWSGVCITSACKRTSGLWGDKPNANFNAGLRGNSYQWDIVFSFLQAVVCSMSTPALQAFESTDRQDVDQPGLLDGRYRVDLAAPLSRFDTAGGKAYGVIDLKDSHRRYYALVHHKGVPHRSDVVHKLLDRPVTNILNPMLQQVIRLKPGGPEHLVTLIEAPGGPSLDSVLARPPLSGHRLRRHVVPGIIRALHVLHEQGIIHRALRPQNIFFSSDTLEDVVLGDCFTAPPGADQPAHYEPLEKSVAEPMARGDGDPTTDMFALGATLLACHLANFSQGEKTDEQFFNARISQGSFWALAAGTEVPGVTGSLLRGLLHDDLDERWTVNETRMWLDSAVPRRRTVSMSWIFSRPVLFRRISYSDRRLLARDFATYPLEAASFLRNLDFANWVQTMMITEAFSDRLEKLISVRRDRDLSGSRHGDHALVARVCAHVDPLGPIRFRSLSFSADGIGPAMAEVFASGDESRLNALLELFDTTVLPSVIDISSDRNMAVAIHGPSLSRTAQIIRRSKGEAGLLYSLYAMNPSLPCQSPKLADYWVNTPQRLLFILDRLAADSPDLSSLLDPHVLAFFCTRVNRAQFFVDRMEYSRNNPVHLMTAVTAFLAHLQATLSLGPLKNLTGHLSKAMRPLAEKLKNRERREATLAKLESLGAVGDIKRLAEAVNLATLTIMDKQAFSRAEEKIAILGQTIAQLRKPVSPASPSARISGYRVAASLGWLVVLVTVMALTLGGR